MHLTTPMDEDEEMQDADIARMRLAEIAADPTLLISGDELQARLDELVS